MDIEKRISTIVDEVQKLRNVCYPENILPIEYLTIFSQSENEFTSLRESLSLLGQETEANNGFKYILKEPLIYQGETMTLVRIRKPDIHRKELGCADLIYNESDYQRLRDIALEKGLDIILRKGYEMIELSDFNINVYAYLVRDL